MRTALALLGFWKALDLALYLGDIIRRWGERRQLRTTTYPTKMTAVLDGIYMVWLGSGLPEFREMKKGEAIDIPPATMLRYTMSNQRERVSV